MTTTDRIRHLELLPAARWHTSLARVASLVVFASAGLFAQAADDQGVLIQPDPAVQAAIGNIVKASPGQQLRDAVDGLTAFDDSSHERLVRQLVYFTSHAANTKDAMIGGVVIRRLGIPDMAIARALTPYLESADAAVDKSVRNILGGLEHRAAGRRPDFSVYRDIIADHLRAGEKLPDALIRYMYDADPGVAMLTLMRANQLREPDEIKTILWAEHTVADTLWKQQYGFLTRDEIDPVAAQQLAKLATHEAWWARLFVVETMRKHAAFRQPGMIEALTSDANNLVCESAARIKSE